MDATVSRQVENERQFVEWRDNFLAIARNVRDAALITPSQAEGSSGSPTVFNTMLEGLQAKRAMLNDMEDHIRSLQQELRNGGAAGGSGASDHAIPESRYPTCTVSGPEAASHVISGLGEEVQIFVESLTGKTTVIHLRATGTVLDLKEAIFRKEGIPPDQQRLFVGGDSLADAVEITSLSFAVVQLRVPLLGGNDGNEDEDLPALRPEEVALIAQQVSEPNSEDVDVPDHPLGEDDAGPNETAVDLGTLTVELREMLPLYHGLSQSLETTQERQKWTAMEIFDLKQQANKRQISDCERKIRSCETKMDRLQRELAAKMDRLQRELAAKMDRLQEELAAKMDHTKKYTAIDMGRLQQKKDDLKGRLETAKQEETNLELQRREAEETDDQKLAATRQITEEWRKLVERVEGAMNPDGSETEGEEALPSSLEE